MLTLKFSLMSLRTINLSRHQLNTYMLQKNPAHCVPFHFLVCETDWYIKHLAISLLEILSHICVYTPMYKYFHL